MSSQSKTYECSPQLIKTAIDSLLKSGPYSPLVLVKQGTDIGARSSFGSKLRIRVKDHEVIVYLIKEGEDGDRVLSVFFHDLSRRISQIEKHQVKQQANAAKTQPSTTKPAFSTAATEVKGSKPEKDDLVEKSIEAASRAVNRIPAPLFAVFMVLALVLVALIAFFMGWQGGYDSRDPVEQPEYTKMIDAHKEEVRNLNSKISDLQSIVIDNQKRIDELKPYKDEYDSKKAELDKRQSDLDSRSSELDSRENAVKQREDAAAAASTSTNSGSSYSSDGSSNGWAYYKNCSAARAAGAAPLYRGQPGYRSSLDRDGDGIACE